MKNGIFAGRRSASEGARRRGFARIRELLAQELVNYYLAGLPALLAATLYAAAVRLAAGSGALLLILQTLSGVLEESFHAEETISARERHNKNEY